jgi:hypothetical protein
MCLKCRYIVLWLWFTIACHAQQHVSAALEQANDFTYTLASGESQGMYSLSAEALLICFYDPSCEDCHALMKRLEASPVIKQLTAEKRLLILAVYPEEDVDLWLENKSHVPVGWINGYDPGVKIILDNLYDFTRLPTLYLLDGQKRFLLKDATAEEIEEKLEAKFEF